METKGIKNRIPLIMGCNRKSAAILSSNKKMQPLHSRETFHYNNKTKPEQKKGSIFIVSPQKETFTTKLPMAGKKNKQQQHKVGTATEHTSVIPEESGGQATPLSSA